jgi:hypothetical protein
MPKQYMTELLCLSCAHTGHIVWEGEFDEKRPVEMSTFIRYESDHPPHFTCLKCGTTQEAS